MSQVTNKHKATSYREKLVAGAILENSSLRNALDDHQAEQLIDWALGKLRAELNRTKTLPDDDALAVVEPLSNKVSSVMRSLNRFVDAMRVPPPPEEEDDAWPQKLIAGIQAIRQTDIAPENALNIEAIYLDRSYLGIQTAFEQLMDIIQQETN